MTMPFVLTFIDVQMTSSKLTHLWSDKSTCTHAYAQTYLHAHERTHAHEHTFIVNQLLVFEIIGKPIYIHEQSHARMHTHKHTKKFIHLRDLSAQ